MQAKALFRSSECIAHRAPIRGQKPGTTAAQKHHQGTAPQPGGNRLRAPFWFLFGEAKRNRKKEQLNELNNVVHIHITRMSRNTITQSR